MKLFASIIVGLGIGFVGGASATNVAQEPELISQQKIDITTAAIKSRSQLQSYLATTPESPIYKMSTIARSNFVASLVFTKHGLGSYEYIDLAGLSVTDAYSILSLFGAQSSLGSVPNLQTATALDRAISERTRKNATQASSTAVTMTVVPLVDPNKDEVCTAYPGGYDDCEDLYGSHCMAGCED